MQRIGPSVAGLPRPEPQGQRPRHHHEDAEGNLFFLGWRIVIPSFGYFTVGVGPGFSPPRASSPNATFALVSMEISSVSGSFRACCCTPFTLVANVVDRALDKWAAGS